MASPRLATRSGRSAYAAPAPASPNEMQLAHRPPGRTGHIDPLAHRRRIAIQPAPRLLTERYVLAVVLAPAAATADARAVLRAGSGDRLAGWRRLSRCHRRCPGHAWPATAWCCRCRISCSCSVLESTDLVAMPERLVRCCTAGRRSAAGDSRLKWPALARTRPSRPGYQLREQMSTRSPARCASGLQLIQRAEFCLAQS